MVKFKFESNFNSAEFEYPEEALGSEEFAKTCNDIVRILKAASSKLGPAGKGSKPVQVMKKTEQKQEEKRASEAQKKYMDGLGIEYDTYVTCKEAAKLIREALEKKEAEEDFDFEDDYDDDLPF